MREPVRKALQLCLIAVVNYVASYGLAVWLARALGVSGYKLYSVAIATLALLASLATLGLEKYAARVLPAYLEKRAWAHAKGYATFVRNLVFFASLALIAAYAAVAVVKLAMGGRELSWPTLVAVALLPVVALATFLLEVLAAAGEVVRATVVYRLMLPLCIGLLFLAIEFSPLDLSPVLAVASYGIAWAIGLWLFIRMARREVPREVVEAEGIHLPREWLQNAAPLLVHSVMMTQFANLGLVGLELLGSTEHQIAVLAAAMQTGGFVILLATATNRLYGPILSLQIERRDYEGLMATKRERHAWIVPAALVFLVAMLIFGRKILTLFGPEYASGYPALCWIAAGATVSVTFAMAPVYLKFVGRGRLVLGITAMAGGSNLVLLWILGPAWGATGAAAAYGLSLAAMALTFLSLALREARKLKRS